MTYFKLQREELEKEIANNMAEIEDNIPEDRSCDVKAEEQINDLLLIISQVKLQQLNKDEDAVRKGFDEDIETIELHKENTAEVMHCDDIIMILKGRKEELGLNSKEEKG